jgi:hypothetical protein
MKRSEFGGATLAETRISFAAPLTLLLIRPAFDCNARIAETTAAACWTSLASSVADGRE